MVQFHPTTLPDGNLLITEAARGETTCSTRTMSAYEKYLPEKMELGPRDMVTRAISAK